MAAAHVTVNPSLAACERRTISKFWLRVCLDLERRETVPRYKKLSRWNLPLGTGNLQSTLEVLSAFLSLQKICHALLTRCQTLLQFMYIYVTLPFPAICL